MRIATFSTKPFERPFFQRANAGRHELVFFDVALREATAPLADGFPAVCAFVNDSLSAPVLRTLTAGGTRLLLLRSAGFNHADVPEAERRGLTILRVPGYSPYAVAEHAVALMLTLNRRIHRAYARVREQNFALDGLMGFDMHGRTVGVVGTGKIGTAVARIMLGFGCRVLATDPFPSEECRRLGVLYADLPDLLGQSDVITLHCPLTPDTRHLIDAGALAAMKPGAMLINTSRGALVDTRAVIQSLKTGRLGYLGIDVYEEEADLFFRDLSEEVIQDDVFVRLLTFPNVVITAHQGFFTREAVVNIVQTTLDNATAFEQGHPPVENMVTSRHLA